jgi:hypothetical protein
VPGSGMSLTRTSLMREPARGQLNEFLR